MKKLLCILMALCLMLTAFVGCNKEDDTKKDETEKTTVETPKEEPEEVKLVGVWNAVMELSEPGTGTIASQNQTIEFKEDGTVVQTVTKQDFKNYMIETWFNTMGVKTEEELKQVIQESFNMSLDDWINQSWGSPEESKTSPMGTWKTEDAGKIIWETDVYIEEGVRLVLECDGLEYGKPVQFVYRYQDVGIVTYTLTK